MRTGIFGGTFDPVHLGHLIVAEQCLEQAHLDEVRFVPAARPPHKSRSNLTPFERRVEMLQLAVASQPLFRVDELEKDRPGPSYTADTLSELHNRHPGGELCLIIGSDCLPDLAGWHDPIRIVTQCQLLVVRRAGWPVWPAAQLRQALDLPDQERLSIQEITPPQLEISSHDLRRRVQEGRSIRYLVPAAVEAYIADKKLYR
jgi:nicotinate-nucleotide adenylyltransferase